MLRDDYIMRAVSQFVRVLARITGLARAQQYEEAGETIDQTLRQLFGFTDSYVRRVSDEDLVAMLQMGSTASVWKEKAAMLAGLVQEQGELAADQGNPDEAYHHYLKALNLLLTVASSDHGTELPPYAPDVDELREKLQDYHLPARTNEMLLDYFERAGVYDRAENVLYEWLEADPQDPAVIQTGSEFYQGLLELSDEELAEGNLPREEVEAGLAQWPAR